MHKTYFFTLLTLFILLLTTLSAQGAANLTVYPTQLTLTPDEQSATITLINQGATEVNMQISAKSWDTDDKGQFVETDTGDFAFFPRLVTIAPKQEKKIRVGYQGDFPTLEKPYRVYLNELPPIKQPDGKKNQLAIVSTLKLSVPLFVKPDTEQHPALPNLDNIVISTSNTSVRVHNTGVTNFLVRGIQLQWQDDTKKNIATLNSTEAKRVLAQRFSQFNLPAITTACTGATTLLAQISLEGQKKPYQQEFKLSGTCVP